MRQVIAAVIYATVAAMTMTPAQAADTMIGAVSISLPAPSGFCNLSPDNPSDNRLITGIGAALGKGGTKLVGISADCQQLTDWRATKRKLLDDYAQYHTPVAMMEKTASDTEIKGFCTEMRARGEKIVADAAPDAKARIEEAFSKIKMNEAKSLGVLAEDPDACYVAILQRLQTEAGTEKVQLITYADTVIKGKHILVYHYARYTGADTVASSLKRIKANVAALYAANK